MMKTCWVENCTGKSGTRGLCEAHYRRNRRHNSFNALRAPNGAPLNWVVENSTKSHGDECLEWPYGRDKKGYGLIIQYRGKGHKPHNLMCIFVHGEPSGIKNCALHSCHNSSCVNPNHLRWGDRGENARDRAEAGRSMRGENHVSAKLRVADVLTIRESAASSALLASSYNVNISTIKRIKNRIIWRHI